MNTK
jgi:hypothetical protein